MEKNPILVEQCRGYRVVTLNRPQRLNAFSETMQRELKRAVEEAEADDRCRALLLTGAGRAFCAGQDLNERLAKDGEVLVLGSTLDSFYNPLVRKLRALPVPVVAAGGPKAKNLREALTGMSQVVQATARGATIGRNIWGVNKTAEACRAFKAVILEGVSVDAALKAEGLTGEE